MLESQFSMAATAVVKAMPFPVDFKEKSNDQLFKQVTFPGEDGTYRVRVVNAGYRDISTVQIKTVNTMISSNTLEGQRFRVKAVLSQPDLGVEESYWLTLKHHDYGEVQEHNQYRVKGISLSGQQSEWVYSEVRESDNRLKIFELIHDVLDIATMLYDDELQLFVETAVKDAFKAMAIKEGSPIPSYVFNPNEKMKHVFQENVHTEFGHLSALNETLLANLQDAMEYIIDQLVQDFKEEFVMTPVETSEFSKVYQLLDEYLHDKEDLVTFILEKFIEDRLDKIVQSSNLEVLLDNGENQEIYLEGTYHLDVKEEILHAAMSLMPTDRFVFNAKSTVQLLTEPVLYEKMDLSILENTRETLHAFKQELNELLHTYPMEEVSKYLRIVAQDIFMPYLAVEQRLADLSIDVQDKLDRMESNDAIVQYELTNEEQITRFMLIKDIAQDLIWGDIPTEMLYQQEIKDFFMSLLTDERCYQINKDLLETIEVFASMGEHASAHYKSFFASQHECISIDSSEEVNSTLASKIINKDSISVFVNDHQEINVKPSLMKRETFLLNLLDAGLIKKCFSPLLKEQHSINLHDESFIQFGILHRIRDYFALISQEYTNIYQGTYLKHIENKSIHLIDNIQPIYQPHLKDSFADKWKDKKDFLVDSYLNDHFELNGSDSVFYALGDVTQTGWPLGKFVLGFNTLKGVT